MNTTRPRPAPRSATRLAWGLPLLLALPACLEHEEAIVVQRDGSLEVTLTASGDVFDLSEGYPIPFGGPWQPVGEDSERWLREVGPDTGSAEVGERVRAGVWPPDEDDDVGKAELSVRGRFATASELPGLWAPASDPYAGAHLRREASLVVREAGGRTVYEFTRTYRARRYAGFGAWTKLDRGLPDEIDDRVDEKLPLSDAQYREVTAIAQDSHAESAEAFARDALVWVFREGDAGLPVAAVEATLRDVDGSVRAAITRPLLEELYRFFIHFEELDDQDVPVEELPELPPELDLQGIVRSLLRERLEASLESFDVAPGTRRAVRGRLEWMFTAFDQTEDLGDEKFELKVRMPGTVVAGNFAELSGSEATWEFEGEELRDRDQVLRVVSVVE